MADTDTMKFGPQWLRQLSDGGGNVCSPPPTPAANIGPFGKFKLADFRYGKEEMLALYRPCNVPPESLKVFTEILSEAGPQRPVSVAPLTEDEQRLLMHGVNSDQVYRMMSTSHRGSGAPNDPSGGGTGEAGVTRGGGGTGSGGRGGRGRGARRAVESVGEAVGGSEATPSVEPAHSHGGQSYHRSGGASRGRGARGAAANIPENSAPGRGGGYRGRQENSQPAAEAGDSSGDWRRVSRQRNPSESDTDWRRGPRTGSTKDNLQQRSSAVGGSGGRVGSNSRGGSSRNEGGGSGSWRQRSGGPASDQRHFSASGNHSGRGRGYSREKSNIQRSNSEEEIPEWVYDENGSEEPGTGFFDSSGAYKPTNSRGAMNNRPHRVRQYSTGSSGAGSGPHNPDPDDYWEDDWETDFTLYDDLDGSARHEAHEEKRSSSDDTDVKVSERQSGENVDSRVASGSKDQDLEHSANAAGSNDNRQIENLRPDLDNHNGPNASRPQPQCLVSSDNINSSVPIRASSCSPTTSASSNVVGNPITDGTPASNTLEQLINSDSSIKAVVTSSGNTSDVSVPASLHHPQQTRWFYRDPQGRTQGPFAAAQMQEWYKAGFFDPSLAVRRECDSNYFSLDSYFKTFGSQTFSGSAPANASSLQNIPVGSVSPIGIPPVNPDSAAMHLLLRQQKMQEMLLKQQLQSPEKSSCPPFNQSQDMMLNWFMFQQQLMSSGLAAEQIEAIKRQHPVFGNFHMFEPPSSQTNITNTSPSLQDPQIPIGLSSTATTVSTPIDGNPTLLSSPTASGWPKMAPQSSDVNLPDDVMAWHNKLLAQQLAHQKAMRMEREEMERERAELLRQHQEMLNKVTREAEGTEERRIRQEAEELERRRKEVEERERQLQLEEAERRQLMMRQKEERRELERRRCELEENERKIRAAAEAEAEQQRKDAEEKARRQREAEERAAKHREAEEKARKQLEAEEAERKRLEEEAAAAAELAFFQQAATRRKKEEAEKKREAAEAAERKKEMAEAERRREAAEAERRREAAEAAEREKRQLEEEAAAERRRRQEEEVRRLQLSKFQLPESARWGSSGQGSAPNNNTISEAASVVFHGPTPSLAEIQRLQQEREEREAQEKRAMRLEREAAKLSAQRQAQMGPWSLNSAGTIVSNVPVSPAVTPSAGRQKSFMEIQAEEQAMQEAESRHLHNQSHQLEKTRSPNQVQMTKSVAAITAAGSVGSNTTGASIWGSNWASKVQQQTPVVPPASATTSTSKQVSAAKSTAVQGSSFAAKQQPSKVSVWGCSSASGASNSKSQVTDQQSKAFPALSSTAADKQTQAPKNSSSKKKGTSREEERVTKLFAAVDGSKDDELTRWCKAALDRIKCPTELDKSMFVEYLVQMETAADIEDMMIAYYDNVNHIKKFVSDFLEKRRQFRKAQEEGTKISFSDTFNSKQSKEDEFQKVGSSNKAGGGKRNRKKKQQKVSNLLNITATADPDRFNAGEIDYAN